jgi:hypothetical protein
MWLDKLWQRWMSQTRTQRRRQRRQIRTRTRMRLALEPLEDRVTPSTTIVVNDPSGGMDNPANVTFSKLGPNVTLIDAINAANNTSATSGGLYTILLPVNQTITFKQPLNNTTVQGTNVVQDQNWYGPDALPAITSNITIEGDGATLQIASGANMRFFYVSGGPTFTGGALPAGSLELDDLTLEGGTAQGGNGNGGAGGGLGAGGAIFNQGTLTLNSDTLTDNKAIGGNGGAGLGGSGVGGGIGSDSSGFGGNFTITGGPIGGNGNGNGGGGGGAGFQSIDNGGNASSGASGVGGGLGGLGGAGGGGAAAGDGGGGGVNGGGGGPGGGFGEGAAGGDGGGGIGGGGGFGANDGGGGGFGGGGGASTSIGGNGGFGGGGGGGRAGGGGFGGGGGGIEVTTTLVPLGGGGAGLGGGIFSMFGSITVINSTLSGNTAQGGNGGGPGAGGGSGFGGAIFNLDGNATLTYATIASNNAVAGTGGTAGNADGGGVYNLAFGNTITQGGANNATLTINNSVIGQNSGGNNLVNDSQNAKNTNLAQISGSSSAVQGGAEQLGNGLNTIAAGAITLTGAPQLAPLANNGGLTQTMAPLSGSPIVGAGIASLVNLPGVDQRGLGRPGLTSPFKPDDGAFQTQTTTINVSNVTTPYTSAGQTITLTANVDAFGNPVTEGQVQFTIDGSGLAPVTAILTPTSLGVASTTIALPSTLNAGSYTIDALYTDTNNPALYIASEGLGTLLVNTANSALTVTDINSPVSYNSNSETLDLTANVASSNGGTVNEGDVVFTVNGVSSGPVAVSNGKASTDLTLTGAGLLLAGSDPNGLSASYTDTATNNYAPANATGNFAVTAAATATSLAFTSLSSTFNSTAAQTVTLTADVTSATGGTVNEGNVAFTLLNPNGINLTAVGTVTAGQATATLAIPPGYAAGSYTINAGFADTLNVNGGLDYASSTTATPRTLTINTAATTTTLTSTSVSSIYNSTTQQLVTLSATVASATGGTVNEGIVTFTVGTNLTVTANVTGGVATATLILPAGFAAGSYPIAASYADSNNVNGTVNFGPSSAATTGTLTVNAASTTTSLLTSTVSSTFNSTTAQTVILSALVASPTGGTVNEGSVLFTVGTLTATANVSSGIATATLTLPPGFAAGSYAINAGYSDSLSANYKSSTAATPGTLTVVNAPVGNSSTVTTVTNVTSPVVVPMGPLNVFAAGLGPTGIDWFEVDSQGDVFVQGLFSGDPQFLSTPLRLLLAGIADNFVLALLAGQSGQSYPIAVLNPFMPLVTPAILAALET